MSRAGERAFATLADYFLQRLGERARAEAETEQMGKRAEIARQSAEAEEKRWRQRKAAEGESRGVEQRLVGGQRMDFDVGRQFNAETGQYDERIYGAAPAQGRAGGGAEWKVNASGLAYRTTPDGRIEYDTTNQRRPAAGGGGGSSRTPKRQWVLDDEGNEVLKTEDEIAAGGFRPLPKDAKGRERMDKERAGKQWRERAASAVGGAVEAATAPLRAIGTGLRSLGEGMMAGRQAAQGPQLPPEDAELLSLAKDTLAQNPMARAEIERRLKAQGKESLIRLL